MSAYGVAAYGTGAFGESVGDGGSMNVFGVAHRHPAPARQQGRPQRQRPRVEAATTARIPVVEPIVVSAAAPAVAAVEAPKDVAGELLAQITQHLLHDLLEV